MRRRRTCDDKLSKCGDGPSNCGTRRSRAQARHKLGAAPTLEELVEDYAQRCAGRLRWELRSFRREQDLEAAVSRATLATRPDGKRYPHQRRIGRAVLPECRARLLRVVPRLRQAQDFDQLHAFVEHAILDIPGVGELLVYDTALRIGAKLRLKPRRVYLHAGARDGARVLLGTPRSTRVLELRDLPGALHQLPAHEVENFLCIYKRRLAHLPRRGH